MRKALVIGLGGTGSWALTHLKQRMLADARFARIAAGGVDVIGESAYGDLNEAWVSPLRAVDVDAGNRPSVGQGVKLTAGREDVIAGAPVGEALVNIQDEPDGSPKAAFAEIREWFSKEEADQYTATQAIMFMTQGLGQIRQFGRMTFFLDMGTNRLIESRLREALNQCMSSPGTGDDSTVYVFVVASVAGGTGAGVLVDTLALLHKLEQERPGNVAFRNIGFIVLPTAFSGVITAGGGMDIVKANGMGTLRELDRMMNAHKTFSVRWRAGEAPATLTCPVFDYCYVLDGSRDSDAPQLDGLNPPSNGLPVAIADAVYAHIFPSSGGAIASEVTNLAPELTRAGNPNRYSSIGTYTILYDWDPLIRSLGYETVGTLVDAMIRGGDAAGKVAASGFLRTGATGDLKSDEAEQRIPALASQGLAEPSEFVTTWAPSDTYILPADADKAAPVPRVPQLMDRFPDLHALTTQYLNEDMIKQVEGDPARSERDGVVPVFWGAASETWDGGTDPSFHAAVNHNVRVAAEEFRRAVRIAVARVMDDNVSAGGITAGLGFANELKVRAQRLSDGLKKWHEEWLAQGVLPAEQADVDRARDKMITDRHRFNDAFEQKAYLVDMQELLEIQVQDELTQAAMRLAGEMVNACDDALTDVDGWRTSMELLKAEAEDEKREVDDARRKMDALPLRRHVPQPGDASERALWTECLGSSVDDSGVETHLPKTLLQVFGDLGWFYHESVEHGAKVFFKHKTNAGRGGITTIRLSDLLVRCAEVFAPLRTKSVFEVLEGGIDPRDLKAEAERLATEIRRDSSRLAAFDSTGAQVAQLTFEGKGGTGHRDWDYVFADWRHEGAGSALSQALEQALSGSMKTHGLASWEDDSKQKHSISGLSGALRSLPYTDKIVCMSTRHLIVLEGFKGVSVLRNAYDARKCGATPGPHVLATEKTAAVLEKDSADLVAQGLLKYPLTRIAPAEVALCGDFNTVKSVATCLACGLIDWYGSIAMGKGSFRLKGAEGPLLAEGADDALADALRDVLTSVEFDHRSARGAIADAADELYEGNRVAETIAALKTFAKEGDPRLNDAGLQDVLKVAAASMAARLSKRS